MTISSSFRHKKALLFDLDDTLYSTSEIYTNGLKKSWLVFKESNIGRDISFEDFNKVYVMARQKAKLHMGRSPSKSNRLIYFHQAICLVGGRPNAKLALELNHAYTSAYDEIDFDPARQVLRHLKNRFKIGIITNQVLESQLRKLTVLDPESNIIDCLVSSEQAGFDKPSKQIFELALGEIECLPSEAIMIGDDWESDIIGALRLGISSVFINPNGPQDIHTESIGSETSIAIPSILELPDLLG